MKMPEFSGGKMLVLSARLTFNIDRVAVEIAGQTFWVRLEEYHFLDTGRHYVLGTHMTRERSAIES